MTQSIATRYASAALAAALAGGVVTIASWGPAPSGAALPPAAIAHYDDMGRAPYPRPEQPTQSAGTRSTDDTGLVSAPARDRVPVHLTIPDLGIDSDVLRTWMDGSGSIVVPEDVLVTGWFDGSRRLDARYGSTVIVGHRDSAVQGTGALYAIEELLIGATITVTDRSGVPHAFIVESVELIDKSALAAEAPRIFAHRGPYRLVLITCGGAFDEGARSYLSNVVITASPASAGSE